MLIAIHVLTYNMMLCPIRAFRTLANDPFNVEAQRALESEIQLDNVEQLRQQVFLTSVFILPISHVLLRPTLPHTHIAMRSSQRTYVFPVGVLIGAWNLRMCRATQHGF